MTPLDRAVHDIAFTLDSLHIGYAIIGGMPSSRQKLVSVGSPSFLSTREL
jgi:hypothetical protein